MTCRRVPFLCGCFTEVLQHMNANGAGAPTGMALGLDLPDQFSNPDALTLTNLVQCVPQFRLQPHAGSPTLRNDVTVNKSAFHHDSLSNSRLQSRRPRSR